MLLALHNVGHAARSKPVENHSLKIIQGTKLGSDFDTFKCDFQLLLANHVLNGIH